MIRLSREIRFSLCRSFDPRITNSWAGWPSTNRIVPWLKMRAVVLGAPDVQTGFLCNVKQLDDMLRQVVVENLMPNYRPQQTAEQLVRIAYTTMEREWQDEATLASLSLVLSPCLSFSIFGESPTMITVTQQFEFSAAHRLHCDAFSDERNLEVFGKCNNPHGHGHNYVVEVSVENQVDADDRHGQVCPLNEFEATVKELVVDRLDHKNLNIDIEHFANINPSVENIAIAIWDWLDGNFGDARLSSVKVFETPKTWAEYRG